MEDVNGIKPLPSPLHFLFQEPSLGIITILSLLSAKTGFAALMSFHVELFIFFLIFFSKSYE